MEEGALGAPVATGAAGELVVQSRLLARGTIFHDGLAVITDHMPTKRLQPVASRGDRGTIVPW